MERGRRGLLKNELHFHASLIFAPYPLLAFYIGIKCKPTFRTTFPPSKGLLL